MNCIGNKRLVITAGKGGVGRSSVAIALGIAACHDNKRVAIVELSGGTEVAKRLHLTNRSYEPQIIIDGVEAISLSPIECLDDYGRTQLHMGALSHILLKNRAMDAFLDAVPGFQDLVQLGKIENLLDDTKKGGAQYDLVIVDGPATGHGLTLLSSAKSMREMTKKGPFHDLALRVEQLLSNPELCASIVVTLPEELPVKETIQYMNLADPSCSQTPLVVINRVVPPPPISPDGPLWVEFERALSCEPSSNKTRAPETVTRIRQRVKTQAEAIEQITLLLKDKPHPPQIVTLPETSPSLSSKESLYEMADVMSTWPRCA